MALVEDNKFESFLLHTCERIIQAHDKTCNTDAVDKEGMVCVKQQVLCDASEVASALRFLLLNDSVREVLAKNAYDQIFSSESV